MLESLDKTRLPTPDRLIPLCQVLDISSGTFPRTVTVLLPYSDGSTKLVRWDGNIALAVNDYVTIQRIGRTQSYVIYSTDGATTGILNNYAATTAPGSTDDVNSGYSVGSVWIDVTGDTAYICVDATASAAVWDEIGAGGGVAPKPGKAMLLDTSGGVATEYASVAAAVTAAEANDVVWGGIGSFSGQVAPSVAITIMGSGDRDTTLTHSSSTISPTATVTLRNLNIVATAGRAIQSADDDVTAVDCTLDSGSTVGAIAAYLGTNTSVDCTFEDCDFTATGTSASAIQADNSSTVLVKRGSINATTATTGTATITFQSTKIIAGVLGSTTVTYRGSALDAKGRDAGSLIKNTSGATRNANDIGYVDASGEFQTTTTANDNVAWHVVTVGGDNNSFLFAKNRGNATIAYTGTAPSAGDWLVTSTTAGSAQQQTAARNDIFAICQAAGSGSVVEALLLTQRQKIYVTSSNEILRINSSSSSDWQSTISSIASAVITYNTPLTNGTEDTIVPTGSSQHGKLLLWNTTKSPDEIAYISSVDTGANTVTVTDAADISGWSTSDVIQVRTPNNTTGTQYFDVEIVANTLVPDNAVTILAEVTISESAGVGQTLTHTYGIDYDANVAQSVSSPSSDSSRRWFEIPLIQRRFGFLLSASGTATATGILKIRGYIIATP